MQMGWQDSINLVVFGSRTLNKSVFQDIEAIVESVGKMVFEISKKHFIPCVCFFLLYRERYV